MMIHQSCSIVILSLLPELPESDGFGFQIKKAGGTFLFSLDTTAVDIQWAASSL